MVISERTDLIRRAFAFSLRTLWKTTKPAHAGLEVGPSKGGNLYERSAAAVTATNGQRSRERKQCYGARRWDISDIDAECVERDVV